MAVISYHMNNGDTLRDACASTESALLVTETYSQIKRGLNPDAMEGSTHSMVLNVLQTVGMPMFFSALNNSNDDKKNLALLT